MDAVAGGGCVVTAVIMKDVEIMTYAVEVKHFLLTDACCLSRSSVMPHINAEDNVDPGL